MINNIRVNYNAIIALMPRTVEWKDNSVIMIDQTKLPNKLEFVTYTDYNQVANAIRTLVVEVHPQLEYQVHLVWHWQYYKVMLRKKNP